MDTLPTPLSRIELYLAKIAGMTVTIPEEPMSRLEMFLAVLAGDTSVAMPAPMSRTELWLAWIGGITPSPLPAVEGACYIGPQKVDVRYFARAAGMPGSPDIPEPQNRTEQYWYQIASNVPIVGFLKYATGISMTLTDILSGIEDLEFIYGDTTQQTYSGKNLFNYNNYPNAYLRGNGGAVSVSNTSGNTLRATNKVAQSNNFVGIPLQDSSSILGKTVTASADVVAMNGVEVTKIALYWITSSGLGSQIGSVLDISSVGSYSLSQTIPSSYPSGVSGIAVTIYGNGSVSGATYGGDGTYVDWANIQLEIGSPATPYEPYVGGIPSPNPDYPQDVNVVTGRQVVTVSDGGSQSQEYEVNLGKNLNSQGIRNGLYTIANGAYNGAKNYVTFQDLLPMAYGTTITVSTQAGESGGFYILEYDGSKSYLSTYSEKQNVTSATFTLSNPNTKYIAIDYAKPGIDYESVGGIQVELGSTATTYAPYFTPIELCKIGEYQDYIYKSGDDWYLHKETGKYILPSGKFFLGISGSNAGADTQSAAGTFSFFGTDIGPSIYDSFMKNARFCSMATYSDIAVPNNVTAVELPDGGFTNRSGTNDRIYYRNTALTGKTGREAGVLFENSVWYGVLTTATDTQITNTALIDQLNALDAAVLPKPNANIMVTASDPNLPGAIKISYYTRHE